MTSTGEFAKAGMEMGRKRYIAFMNELEAAKAVGDADRLQMRASKDDGGASGTTQRDRAKADPENPAESKSDSETLAAATQPDAARRVLTSSTPSAAPSSPVQVQVRPATGTSMRPGLDSSASGPTSTGSQTQTGDYTVPLDGSGVGSVSGFPVGLGLGGPAGSVPSVAYGMGGKSGRVAPAPASSSAAGHAQAGLGHGAASGSTRA